MKLQQNYYKLASVDPDRYETTLTITGAGGFGKTTTAISLCHHPLIKKQFTDGFVFIELGPQATDPCIKLKAIYDLLTNEQCDINIVEQKIDQLISDYFCNLLVIIDDVWHVEDAEPLVKAFAHCKTILTTRMNNIEQYIPPKQSVAVGPMTEDEAISLLTSGVIDISQLSQEDVKLLDDLAQDVHLWPLLLSLIRGQLSHNLKQFYFSYHEAIQNVQSKLHHKGLVAFDKDNIESINKSRKLAVKACIEMTLELLTKSLSNKIKTLILFTGVGTSLQTELLYSLWNISKQAAEDTVDVLWAYGLVQLTDTTIISPNNIKQHCVEVHAVISQYIIESMDSVDARNLSPMGKKSTSQLFKALKDLFFKTYRVHDPSTLMPVDYLKYKLSEIESFVIPFTFKIFNMLSIIEPHLIILALQEINDVLMASPDTIDLLSLLGEEMISLKADCEHAVKDAHKLCRKLNQGVQRNLHYKGYDKFIQTVEEFIKIYPVYKIAEKSVTMVKNIIPYCEGKLLHFMMKKCQFLQTMTCDYHEITLSELPHIQYILKHHELITGSLLHGSPDIAVTYHYFISGKTHEELDLIHVNRLIKLQEIIVHNKPLQPLHLC